MGGKISQRAGGAAAATLAESSPARLSALRCPCAPAPSGRPAPRPPTALPSSRAARIKRQLDARNRGAKPRRAAVCRPAAAVARCRHAALPKTAEPRRPQACQHRSLRVEKTITNKMNARPCPPTTLPGRAATPRPPPTTLPLRLGHTKARLPGSKPNPCIHTLCRARDTDTAGTCRRFGATPASRCASAARKTAVPRTTAALAVEKADGSGGVAGAGGRRPARAGARDRKPRGGGAQIRARTDR